MKCGICGEVLLGSSEKENQRKLEAFDELLAACENAVQVLENHFPSHDGSSPNWSVNLCFDLCTAIAKANPQAR